MTVLAKASAGFIDYDGKEIYYVDCSGKKTIYDLVDSIEQANMYRKIHIEDLGKKNMLTLVDISNSFVFGKAFYEFKRFVNKLKPYTKKHAIIGLKRPKRIFMNMAHSFLGTETKAFDDIEEAKRWLIE